MSGPGSMDQILTFERPERTKSEMGGYDVIWTPYKTVWGKVEAKSNSESEESERTYSSQSYVVQIWNDTSIEAGHRIVWDGSLLNIIAPRHLGNQPLYLFIDCETGSPQ